MNQAGGTMVAVKPVISSLLLKTILAVAVASISLLIFSGIAFAQQEPVGISIDYVQAEYSGHYVYVDVSFDNPDPSQELDQFNLVVEYDASALTFMEALTGDLLQNCGWESFTYSWTSYGIRITAAADSDSIPGSPDCYLGGATGNLVTIKFYVTNNHMFDCYFLPIQFRWDDCVDNHLKLKDVNEYIVSDSVYAFDPLSGSTLIPIEDTLPSYGGAPDSCLSEFPDGANVSRLADFWDGGVQMPCPDSIDSRGDLNLNLVPNEIADFVIFENYLLYGLSAFEINVEGQTAATDINNDGIFLTYRDFVYLWRIIIGDAIPYPKSSQTSSYSVTFLQHDPDSVSILLSDVPLAGAYLIFDGSIVPTLIPSDFEVAYNYDTDLHETRVVVEPVDRETTIGNGPLMTFEGSGILIDAYAADYEDSQFDVTISVPEFEMSVTYVMNMLDYIFAGGAYPSPSGFADADCSGAVDIDDVVHVIAYLFAGGPPPGGC
ncbi:MAG: hypothetical protein ABIK83_10755 [Candidatus Zixiibacteriota bacterium]